MTASEYLIHKRRAPAGFGNVDSFELQQLPRPYYLEAIIRPADQLPRLNKEWINHLIGPSTKINPFDLLDYTQQSESVGDFVFDVAEGGTLTFNGKFRARKVENVRSVFYNRGSIE